MRLIRVRMFVGLLIGGVSAPVVNPRVARFRNPDFARGNETVLEHLSRAKQRHISRLHCFAESNPRGLTRSGEFDREGRLRRRGRQERTPRSVLPCGARTSLKACSALLAARTVDGQQRRQVHKIDAAVAVQVSANPAEAEFHEQGVGGASTGRRSLDDRESVDQHA